MRFLRPLALVASLASLGAGSVLAADALGPAELAADAIPRPRLSDT